MAGFPVLENVKELFFLTIGLVQRAGKDPENREHDQDDGRHSQRDAEIKAVMSGPLRGDPDPASQYREADRKGEDAPQHQAT